MPANCCNDTLAGKVASPERQVCCPVCLTIWTGRGGKWVTGGNGAC